MVVTGGRRSRVETLTPRGVPAADAVPTPALVSAAAHAASENVALVADSLRGAADALAGGDWRTGRCLLVQGTTSVRTLVLVSDMLASIPGLVRSSASTVEIVVACVRATVATLESKRQRGDWDGVASLLRADLPPLLEEWSTVLRALGDRALAPQLSLCHSNASGRVALDLPEAG